MVKIFFRNDDVWVMTRKFEMINKIFLMKKIPLHHSVIPINISESSSKKFIDIKAKNPEIIEYGQHGYSHKNYGNENVKFEFLGRSYEMQMQDIKNGKEIIENKLGPEACSVFTPPFHKYDENTLKAVNGLGFKIFSADHRNRLDMGNYDFSFVPVSISFNLPSSKKGKFITNLNYVMKEFKEQRDKKPYIGVFIHHEMLDVQGFRNLLFFLDYLKKEKADFCHLSEAI